LGSAISFFLLRDFVIANPFQICNKSLIVLFSSPSVSVQLFVFPVFAPPPPFFFWTPLAVVILSPSIDLFFFLLWKTFFPPSASGFIPCLSSPGTSCLPWTSVFSWFPPFLSPQFLRADLDFFVFFFFFFVPPLSRSSFHSSLDPFFSFSPESHRLGGSVVSRSVDPPFPDPPFHYLIFYWSRDEDPSFFIPFPPLVPPYSPPFAPLSGKSFVSFFSVTSGGLFFRPLVLLPVPNPLSVF